MIALAVFVYATCNPLPRQRPELAGFLPVYRVGRVEIESVRLATSGREAAFYIVANSPAPRKDWQTLLVGAGLSARSDGRTYVAHLDGRDELVEIGPLSMSGYRIMIKLTERIQGGYGAEFDLTPALRGQVLWSCIPSMGPSFVCEASSSTAATAALAKLPRLKASKSGSLARDVGDWRLTLAALPAPKDDDSLGIGPMSPSILVSLLPPNPPK